MKRRFDGIDPSMRSLRCPITISAVDLFRHRQLITTASDIEGIVRRAAIHADNAVIRNSPGMISASCRKSPLYAISAGHSLRVIPAPGALVGKLLLRGPAGLDSFPKTSSGPLPKSFLLG